MLLDELLDRAQSGVQLLELVVIGLLGRPANDEALVVRSRGLGYDVEVDVIDLLVRDLTVVLREMSVVWRVNARTRQAHLQQVVVLNTECKGDLLGRR